MLKKLVRWIEFQKKSKEERAKLIQMNKYYKLLREGGLFVKYINDDLNKTQNDMNRHARRRMQKSLQHGEITEEIIHYYMQKIDNVLKVIHERLNPPKPGAVKINEEVMNKKIQETKGEIK